MPLRRLIDAATEPITTAEAKTHLRVTAATDDTYIDTLVMSVRQVAENELRRSLITQSWVRTLDEFPEQIQLRYPPIIAVTSVKYYNTAGVQQTLAASEYSLDYQSEPGWIVPAYNVIWPDTLDAVNAVEVIYTAGYGGAADVPQAIKAWILLHVGHLYENREATMPGISITPLPFLDSLLDPYRVVTF